MYDNNSGNRTASVLKNRWRRVIVALISLCLATSICLLQPILSGMFFDVLLAESSRIGGFKFNQLVYMQMFSFITEPLLTWLYVRSVLTIAEDLIAALRMQLHAIIIRKPIAFFDKNKVGNQLQRFWKMPSSDDAFRARRWKWLLHIVCCTMYLTDNCICAGGRTQLPNHSRLRRG